MPKERHYIPLIMKYLRDTVKQSCAVEVKLARGNSLPFSALSEHQERALILASGKGMYHKIADGSGQQTPFDAFCLVGVPAYVAIVYGKVCCLILINDFVQEKLESKRKSLTSTRAEQLSTISIKL